MTVKGSFAIASIDVPELDGFVAGTGEEEVAFRMELDSRNVVVVSKKGLKA